MPDDAKERLQNLHLALEAAIEQLTYAQNFATKGSEIGAPSSSEVVTIERALGDMVVLRNDVRERLMKVLSRPTLGIVK